MVSRRAQRACEQDQDDDGQGGAYPSQAQQVREVTHVGLLRAFSARAVTSLLSLARAEVALGDARPVYGIRSRDRKRLRSSDYPQHHLKTGTSSCR